jgi:hypothetical protein
MNSGEILRCVMILTGIYLLLVSVRSLARRRLTEPFCMAWGGFSLLLLLGGILLHPDELNRYISTEGMLIFFFIGVVIVGAAYLVSWQVSELVQKNQELTMQISLLNTEFEHVLRELEELKGSD